MILEYLAKAIESARYETMEDGAYFGALEALPGAWAQGNTLEECRRELLEVAEDWILVGVWHHDHLPILDGIDINIKEVVDEDQ